VEKKAQSLAVWPGCTRFTCASTFCALLASSSSFFSLSESLSPSSQVSRGALGLLRYDGSGRVHRGNLSGSLSPSSEVSVLRRECAVVVVVFVLVPPSWL
jgi:hypothetical protein